jgi:FdhD protein
MSQSKVRYRAGVQWRADGETPIERATPHEAAIGLSFNGRPHTVLMATPADLEDLAVGFAVTEGVMGFEDIRAVTVSEAEQGFLADLQGRASKARPRSLEGRSSCGLCGVQRLADAMRPIPRVAEVAPVNHEAVQRAVSALGDRQDLGRQTRATHAAAFADPEGVIVAVREDVGRHNALDKLAGALLRAGEDAGRGFVVVTSRCSFEMVEKAARLGAPIIVAVSAPTDLAIAKAEEAGMTLVALARADGHTVFTRPDRLKAFA